MSYVIRQYVIYERPRDFPGHYVVRGWTIGAGTMTPDPMPMLATTLEDARGHVPPSYVRTEPCHGDDPCIVEVWV